MRIPDFLMDNGKIGFIAPSFGCNIEPYKSAFKSAIERFKQQGFNTVTGPNCFSGNGIGISATPQECAKEFEDYYKSDDNDVLISCGGGELMCEILEYIDFDMIKKQNPKWFMGYSDNTNLTFLLTTLCDVASIYASCAASFGMEPWHESLKDDILVLTGQKSEVFNYDKWEITSLKDEEHPLTPYNLTQDTIINAYIKENDNIMQMESCEFEGRLVGGCLDCLQTLCGTKFDKVNEFNEKYRKDGIIWFIESCDLNVMGIRRALWQLKHSGWFKYVKGFLIGRPMHFDEPLFGLDRVGAYMGALGELGVPVIMDADIGHLPPAMPIVSGAYAKVSYNKKTDNNSEKQIRISNNLKK